MQDSFGMMSEMIEAGVIPTVDTFNTLMDSCSSRHDYEAVVRLYRQMVQAGRHGPAVKGWSLQLLLNPVIKSVLAAGTVCCI